MSPISNFASLGIADNVPEGCLGATADHVKVAPAPRLLDLRNVLEPYGLLSGYSRIDRLHDGQLLMRLS